jgi:hypothetical protein
MELIIYSFLSQLLLSYLFALLLIELVLQNDVLIAIGVIAIPPVSLFIVIQVIEVHYDIISLNVGAIVLGARLPWSLTTILYFVRGGSTILARSSDVLAGGLALETAWVPCLQFGLLGLHSNTLMLQ